MFASLAFALGIGPDPKHEELERQKVLDQWAKEDRQWELEKRRLREQVLAVAPTRDELTPERLYKVLVIWIRGGLSFQYILQGESTTDASFYRVVEKHCGKALEACILENKIDGNTLMMLGTRSTQWESKWPALSFRHRSAIKMFRDCFPVTFDEQVRWFLARAPRLIDLKGAIFREGVEIWATRSMALSDEEPAASFRFTRNVSVVKLHGMGRDELAQYCMKCLNHPNDKIALWVYRLLHECYGPRNVMLPGQSEPSSSMTCALARRLGKMKPQ